MRRDRQRERESTRSLATRRLREQLSRRRTLERRRHVRQVRVVPRERTARRLRQPQMHHHDVLVRIARQLIMRVPVVVRTVEAFRDRLGARMLVRVCDTHQRGRPLHGRIHEHRRLRQVERTIADEIGTHVVHALQRHHAEHRLIPGVLGHARIGEARHGASHAVDLRLRLGRQRGWLHRRLRAERGRGHEERGENASACSSE